MFEKVSSIVNNFMKHFNSSYVPSGEIKPYRYTQGLMFTWNIYFLSQKLVSKKHKNFCEYFPELLSVEPNNLVIFLGQICDNLLATTMEINIV